LDSIFETRFKLQSAKNLLFQLFLIPSGFDRLWANPFNAGARLGVKYYLKRLLVLDNRVLKSRIRPAGIKYFKPYYHSLYRLFFVIPCFSMDCINFMIILVGMLANENGLRQ
jgi:hypothetical protein